MSDIIDSILSSIQRTRIFKDRELLMPDYIPNELPHREEQIRRLVEILSPLARKEKPNNIFIYGLTGTGKTAVTKFVLKRLKEKLSDSFIYTYINTRQVDTPYRILADILENLGVRVPFTGISTAELYKRFLKKVSESSQIYVIVLDEIDALVKKHGDDILYRLTRANYEVGQGKVSIIGITNDVKFIEFLDPRVKSSLSEEEIVFPPYNADELEDILRKRAQLAFNEGKVDDEVIKLCAALAARDHGDARRALDLLRVAGEIAERENANKVTVDHVNKARVEIERDRVYEVVSTLPFHSKLVLVAIILGYKEKRRSLTTGEIYEIYSKLTKKIGVESVTQRRVSEILNELDMLGIITAKVVNRGRYGKTKEVNIAVNIETVIKAISEKDTKLAGIWS